MGDYNCQVNVPVIARKPAFPSSNLGGASQPVRQDRQNAPKDPYPVQQTELLTVVELAARLIADLISSTQDGNLSVSSAVLAVRGRERKF